MKILYIADIFPAVSQIFISREILDLERKGVEILIFSLHRSQETLVHDLNRKIESEVFYGANIKATKIRKGIRHLAYFMKNPIRYFQTFQASKMPGLSNMQYMFTQLPLICKKICDFNPDQIHCHFGWNGMLNGWLISKLLNIPFSVTLHGSDVLVNPYKNLGVVLKDASRVICVSEKIRQILRTEFSVSKEKIHIIRCGIDPEAYAHRRPLPEKLKMICVARLHSVKGLSSLIEACAILETNMLPFECSVYGDGDLRMELEDLINSYELSGKVHLHGAVANEKLPEIYAAHSLFVLPSLSEGVPVVLMEAMASGLPVVASNVGGVSEIVEHEVNGLLVEPNSPQNLADAIRKIYQAESSYLEKMRRQNVLKIEEKFNSKIENNKLHSLFGFIEPDLN